MKNIYILSLIVLVFACKPKQKSSQFEVDKTSYKKELSQQLGTAVLWYQNAAEMRLAYYQAYHQASMLLDHKLATVKDKRKPAVVLDIDETVLDNSPYEAMLINRGLTYTSAGWKKWTSMAKAEALPGVKRFVDHAMKRNVEVFYISNRSVDELQPTLENLIAEGLPNADSTHVLLKKETSDKTARRAKVSQDFNVLVFVGDNLTDYSELYADRDNQMGKDLVDENLSELLSNFIMLPNPMYGEWEKAIYDNDHSQSDSAKYQLRKNALKAF